MSAKKAKRQTEIDATIQLDGYRIICDAIEIGVRRGLTRAWKHRQAPKGWTQEVADHVAACVEGCVTGEIAEIIK